MDNIDSKIIQALSQNGRLSWAELGEQVGLTAPGVADRVRRLMEQGTLLGFEARIAPKAVGCTITAFVSVTSDGPKSRKAVLARALGLPEVLEIHHVAGDADFLLKVRCRDMDDLEGLLTGELKAHGAGVRTHTTVVLSTHKESLVPPTVAAPTPKKRKRP